eukprot:1162131-Pelagomonas_calceolata.AAC.17
MHAHREQGKQQSGSSFGNGRHGRAAPQITASTPAAHRHTGFILCVRLVNGDDRGHAASTSFFLSAHQFYACFTTLTWVQCSAASKGERAWVYRGGRTGVMRHQYQHVASLFEHTKMCTIHEPRAVTCGA